MREYTLNSNQAYSTNITYKNSYGGYAPSLSNTQVVRTLNMLTEEIEDLHHINAALINYIKSKDIFYEFLEYINEDVNYIGDKLEFYKTVSEDSDRFSNQKDTILNEEFMYDNETGDILYNDDDILVKLNGLDLEIKMLKNELKKIMEGLIYE